MPFDRLCRAVDDWALETGQTDVFAQIGRTDWRPRAMEWVEMLRPDELRAKMAACDLVVGHAGMGTIITAMEHGKPIVVMPRLSSLRETRNDHQMATAKRFEERGALYRVDGVAGLRAILENRSSLKQEQRMSGKADQALLEALRCFILGA